MIRGTGMSNEMIHYFTGLIHSVLHNTDFEEECPGGDWEQVYLMAKKNNVLPLLYNQISRLSVKYHMPEDILSEWKSISFRKMLHECEKLRLLRELLQRGKEQGITFILFKGVILGNLYPGQYTRVSCDSDILVYERDKERAIRLLQELKFEKIEEASKEMVYAFYHREAGYEIELHFSLWEDYKSKRIDMLEQMELTKESSLIRIRAYGMEITTLGYMEHLIFQMFHIIKHFSLQGVNVKYLIDITLYINRYQEQLDIREFWRRMKLLGYESFCDNFFSICIHYFGMSVKIMEGRIKYSDATLHKLLIDLVNVGSAYSEANAKWELLDILTPYFTGEQDLSEDKTNRKWELIFPQRKYLPPKYSYAQKYNYLLPVAWLHRILCNIPKWIKYKKDINQIKERFQVVEHRLSLMRSLGLVEER